MAGASRFGVGDIVILAVTSEVRTPRGFGEALIADWQAAGLLKESVLKPVFASIEQALVIRIMGRLSSGDAQQVGSVIGDVIGDVIGPFTAQPAP